jgi:MFS family permease
MSNILLDETETIASPIPAAAAKPHGYKWLVVFMLWWVCFFNYADRQAISAVFPKLKEEFGFTKEQLGLIGSAFMFVYAGGAPLAGFLCDRFRRKNIILGGCLFWSVVTVTTAWCSKLWQFVTVRALEGVGETFYFPASLSLISDYHGQPTRSRALSFHQSSVYVGTIAGSWLGAWLADVYGWRVGFYFFGGLGLLLALVLFAFLKEPRRGQAESNIRSEPHAAAPGRALALREAWREIFRVPAVPLLMVAFAAANFVATIFLVWAPTFLYEKFHFTLAKAGLVGALSIHLSSAVSVPIAGALADLLSRRHVAGRMVVQVLGLAFGSAFIYQLGQAAEVNSLLMAMAGFGFCKGFYDSGIFASMYDHVEARARGAAAGLMNTIGWSGGALGPLYVGWASQHGGRTSEIENMSQAISLSSVVYLFSAVSICIGILSLTWPKRVFARSE